MTTARRPDGLEEARRLRGLIEIAKRLACQRNTGPQAIEVNTEVLKLDPHEVGSYTRRGTCYLAAGDLDAARADFRAALALDPNNRIALNRLRELEDAHAAGGRTRRAQGITLNRLQELENLRSWGGELLRSAPSKNVLSPRHESPTVTAPPQPTWVYHFTPIENLSGILESDGLACNNLCETQQISVAHQRIQDRRSRKPVPCGPGGNLHDYVPFYFCPRLPMMYAINGGAVASYDKGQGELVYLVLKLQSVAKNGLKFVFTDRHAVTGCAAFYTDPTDLQELDWDAIPARWWDPPEYPDRKERKQAEFLVHEFVPWDLVEFLAVMTPRMKERVKTVLAQHPNSARIPVRVERAWYY